MGRGLVRSIGTSMGGSTGVSTTVSATGATGSTTQGMTNPPGLVVTGTLEDIQSNQTYNFIQPFGAEIGLAVGSKVKYDAVTASGQTVAVSLVLVHRGEVDTVGPNGDAGTLIDKSNGQNIPFVQPYCAELGLQKGTKVNFQIIVNPNTGAITAVSLTTKENQ